VIPGPTDDQVKFVVDGKKDEVVWVIMIYISREIRFHLSGIDYPRQLWKKDDVIVQSSRREPHHAVG
jgi:hypothetical protein